MSDWMFARSRHRSARLGRNAFILLMFLVIVVVLIKFLVLGGKPSRMNYFKGNESAAVRMRIVTPAALDSLIVSLFGQFGLDNEVRRLSPQRPNEATPTSFQVSWPSPWPFAWLTRALQTACWSYQGLTYDACESQGGDTLYLSLIARGDTLVSVTVARLVRLLPPPSRLAIVFDRLSDLPDEQVRKLIGFQIPFGFILEASTFPTPALFKQLLSSQGECFLEFAGRLQDWQLTAKVHGWQVNNADRRQEGDIGAMLDRFPRLKGFFVRNQEAGTGQIAHGVVTEAARRNLVYVYQGRPPGPVDSMAYAFGLTIVKRDDFQYWDCVESAQCKQRFCSLIFEPGKANKGVLVFSAKPVMVDLLGGLLNELERLNISLVLPSELLDPIDRL